MEWIICAIVAIVLTVIVIAITMHFVLGKNSQISQVSGYILNKFEPDNTSPNVTELVEFHKSNEKVKYIVD